MRISDWSSDVCSSDLLFKFESMAFSCAVIDLAAFGIEIDGERLFEMDGDLRAGLDIDGGEGLAVQLVHPIGHVPHATGQDATYGFVAGNADAADGTVCAHVGHLAAVAVDKRPDVLRGRRRTSDRKSTRLNSSH